MKNENEKELLRMINKVLDSYKNLSESERADVKEDR